MANGTRSALTIGNVFNAGNEIKCCMDAEYGIVYTYNGSNGCLYATVLSTGITTQVAPNFGFQDQATVMTEPTSAGKIWLYTGHSSYDPKIFNITDRTTGAGTVTTYGTRYVGNQVAGCPVFYHRPTHTNYIMAKYNSELLIVRVNLTTGTATDLRQLTTLHDNVGAWPRFNSYCKVGESIIIGTTNPAGGTNPYQLFVYNIENNSTYWLPNYYATLPGNSNLAMNTVGVFALGNTVNFFSKGYIYTYNFNLETAQPDMNAWSRTSHSLSGAGYDDAYTLLYATSPTSQGNVYIFGGTVNSVAQSNIVKASYFLPTPSAVQASIVDGKIQLSWIDNSDEESFYVIERKSNIDSSYIKKSVDFAIKSDPVSAAGQRLTWIDEDADIANYSYSYKLKARYLQL